MKPLATDAGPTHSLGSPGLAPCAGWPVVCPAVCPFRMHREGSLRPDPHPSLTRTAAGRSVTQGQTPDWTSEFPLLCDSRGALGLLSGPRFPHMWGLGIRDDK